MCDTLVVTPEASADRVMLFGKNSDRPPNEAQYLAYVPAADHDPGSRVMCTYVKIDQVAHTHATLLSRPFWIWGAEMGVNEHGVAIGNEAVFTRMPYDRGPGLIGMDLLRLALERAAAAPAAVEVITSLLARYGQGGNCASRGRKYYHNSFLIADPSEAWVLETAGRVWAARRVKGVYSISNGLTIGRQWDAASPGLVDYAVKRAWCRKGSDFSFARSYSDRLYTRLSSCRSREARSRRLLERAAGGVGAADVMSALRDHGVEPGASWRPDRGLVGSTVCMHAAAGPVRASGTAGSLVCRLDARGPVSFATGTAAPCLSVFKPVWVDSGLPDLGPAPSGTYSDDTLFWRHERFHRTVLRDYEARASLSRAEREALERRFVDDALQRAAAPADERLELSRECFALADAAERGWADRAAAEPARARPGALYSAAWAALDREAAMPS